MPLGARRWWHTPLIAVLWSPTPLTLALRRWRQEGIWLGRKRNITREKARAQGSLRFGGDRGSLEMWSEDRIAPLVWAIEVKSALVTDALALRFLALTPYLTLGFYY